MSSAVRKNRGFTLMEVLVVVVIIGLLVTVAVPGYFNTVERGRASKARVGLDGIRKAQLRHRAHKSVFANDLAGLNDYDAPVFDGGDTDGTWDYSTTNAGLSKAIRNSGVFINKSITLDPDGDWAYSAAAPGAWKH